MICPKTIALQPLFEAFSKGVLLAFKCSPFACQKESFYNTKGALLESKRTPFFMPMAFYAKQYDFCLLAHHLLGQYKIEYNGKQEHYSHAVFGKYGAHDFGEYGKHSGGLGEAKAYTERQTDNDHVAL